MDSRVADIVSQIRLNLKQVDVADIQNGDIYGKAKRVQGDIMLRTKCLEKEFILELQSGMEYVDFSDYKSLQIFRISPSWNCDLTVVSPLQFEEYKNDTDPSNVHIAFFNRRLYIRPIPTTSGNIIIVWGFQTNPLIDMDDDMPPEVPEECDDALILGICAQYDKSFKAEYEEEIDLLQRNVNIKHNYPKQAQRIE